MATSTIAAATATLNIIKTALEGELAKYMVPGKQLLIKIKGAADALPITGNIAYNGRYGTLEREPVLKGSNLMSLSLNPSEGITDNDQLALARAVSMKDYLVKQVPSLKKMDTKYDYVIEVDEENKGGEYRRVSVEFTFVEPALK